MALSEEIERVQGVSGELVLRRGPAGLEIVANGVFLVSTANAVSSRALTAAAWPYARGDGLEVLIGGLGIGDALGEALWCERVASVTVAELEPAVLRWFREYGGETARLTTDAERAGRVTLLTADVAEVIQKSGRAWDVIALDTDNGPEWLVRAENSRLYSAAGLCRVRDALRVDGVAVFWSPEDHPAFEGDLRDVFAEVHRETAVDTVCGRRLTSTVYVARGAGGD